MICNDMYITIRYATKRNTQVFCNDIFKYFMFYVLSIMFIYLFDSIIKRDCESAETLRKFHIESSTCISDSSNGQSFELSWCIESIAELSHEYSTWVNELTYSLLNHKYIMHFYRKRKNRYTLFPTGGTRFAVLLFLFDFYFILPMISPTLRRWTAFKTNI